MNVSSADEEFLKFIDGDTLHALRTEALDLSSKTDHRVAYVAVKYETELTDEHFRKLAAALKKVNDEIGIIGWVPRVSKSIALNYRGAVIDLKPGGTNFIAAYFALSLEGYARWYALSHEFKWSEINGQKKES